MPFPDITSLTRPASDPLRDDLRTTLIQGRWLLVAVETGLSALLLAREHLSVAALMTLGLLFCYNAASLILLDRTAFRQIPIALILAMDLLFVGLTAYQTGGVHSPFLGQCYLIVLAASLLYDLKGGIAVGVVSSAMAIGLALPSPSAEIEILTNLVPYFLLAGSFTGFLVLRLKTYFRHFYAAELRERTNEREMALARSVQQAALPEKVPSFPGVECALLNRSAGDVGGDFLLFLPPQQSDTFGVVIGDVSGKGLPAALASTGIAHLLPYLRPLENPARALGELNQDLLERLPEEFYATLLLLEVSTVANRLRLWTAGHLPPLLWRAGEKRVVFGGASDLPMGMFPDWKGTAEEIAWEIGDILLLYTDGLTEARNAMGEQFGSSRAAAVLAENADKTAEEIVQALLDAVVASGTLVDDLTLFICKRTGVT